MSLADSEAAQLRAERHPLLFAMSRGDAAALEQEGNGEGGEGGLGPGLLSLAQRLEELRWGEQRRGPWARPPEAKVARTGATNGALREGGPRKTPGREGQGKVASASERAALKIIQQGGGGTLGELAQLMDTEGQGTVPAEAFVPLMFWLGLTRRRSAALATLELAFGPGDVDLEAIVGLSPYIEVQVKLVEGLSKLARRESLQQLCEFMIDNDMSWLRTWFYSMKRDPDGNVNIVEVQNLFSRMEVTSHRQALFRLLNLVASHPVPRVGGPQSGSSPGGGKKNAPGSKKFSIDSFCSLCCRCVVAWCMYRTANLLQGEQPGPASLSLGAALPAGGASPHGTEHDMGVRWTQLQRKIIVSLLVNHRFWGRESRQVLSCLRPPGGSALGEGVSPEQWLALFQRVRAQGIAAILPIGDEAADPNWLRMRTQHDSTPGAAETERQAR